MNKFTAVAIAIIVLCFGGLIIWSTSNKNETVNLNNYDENSIIKATDDNGNIADHVRGKADSKVLVLEYADLSCPGCANIMPRMTKLHEEYGDKVAFVFRHFPLKDHQNSRSASAAVESAGFQDYYWEMLEALYSNRSDWLYATGQERTDIYVKIFKEIAPDGDEAKFRSDMNEAKIEKKIAFDYNIGKDKSKVTATPAIFVNGTAIDMTQEDKTFDDIINDIKKLIEEGLKEDEGDKQESEDKKTEDKKTEDKKTEEKKDEK